MRTLSIASFLVFVLTIATIAKGDDLTDRCSGISTNNQKVVVLIYRGVNSTRAGGDATILVSESNKGHRVFTSRISALSEMAQVMTSGNNLGLKIAMQKDGSGYLWLGDGREGFSITCQHRWSSIPVQ